MPFIISASINLSLIEEPSSYLFGKHRELEFIATIIYPYI